MATGAKGRELFKFPRTRHLFDAGGSGVSRDDLLMDPGDENQFYSPPARGRGRAQQAGKLVAVEEKVDGANLGISLGGDMQLCVQNRSHYVNSKTHRQFSTLDAWLQEHSSTLYSILEPGNLVLFGEWLYAKHSIHYTRLPGLFMAFDIFDKEAGKFFSWRERNRRLEGSGIPVVRLISETTITNREEVRKLLDTPSVFYDGPCEGVYLRMDEDMQQQQQQPGAEPGGSSAGQDVVPPYCVHRGKVVRPDFMQGIEEQWTRQQLTKNIVVYT